MSHHSKAKQPNKELTDFMPTYGEDAFMHPVPKNKIPENPMSPRVAKRLIDDELDLDEQNSSDLGSYITDYMDPEADELIQRTIGKVFIDHPEYPQASKMGERVINMIQDWYNGTPSKKEDGFIGTVTIGSSEAIMLGLIAHRFNWEKSWKERRLKTGPDGIKGYYRKDKPFMMYARDVHTCWEKYSLYFNTPDLVFNLSDGQCLVDPKKVEKALNKTIMELHESNNSEYQHFAQQVIEECDYDLEDEKHKKILSHKKLYELVFVVGCVVGTTFTGEADPVEKVDAVLRKLKKEAPKVDGHVWDIPIHVDAASGGFIVPFTKKPGYKWNFELEQVKSINVSNHKFGLVYPGVGSVVYRDDTVVADELIYKISYLGKGFTDYTLNFSRGSAMVIASYYNLIRMGKKGYEHVILNCVKNAQFLNKLLSKGEKTKNIFKVISDNELFPMVVWQDTRSAADKERWDLRELSNELEKCNWKLPAYPLPYNSSTSPDGPLVMRVVCRQDVSRDKVEILYQDICDCIDTLEKRTEGLDLSNPDIKKLAQKNRKHRTFKGSIGC
jgi:glutamate decarboxylase